ncbi:hypothetical protein [Acinetobacter sp. JW]|uniref:hypothetical protein n=3 Tax=Moraxellaceae TaxID=468 RepID=UPI000E312F96|nr:hypothetical protein [Acinetobacter sp. JW]RFF22805.1 hypothetical protein DZ985_18160 [Acinetobacter sp. JW]
MNQKIEEGLEDFNKLSNNLRSKINEFRQNSYINYIQSEARGNDLLNAIDEFKDLSLSTFNNLNEKEFILFLNENISGLLSNASRKDVEKIKQDKVKDLFYLDDVLKADYDFYFSEIAGLTSLTQRYSSLRLLFDDILFDNFKGKIVEVNKEILGFRRSKNILDNLMTENIYDIAVAKYKKLEKKYRKYFYRSVPIVIIIAILTFLSKKLLTEKFGIDEFSYWVLKISILLLGITLISYFIKQSSHYQRLADQNYQTQVELQAYPSFMESVPTEE